MFHAIRLRLRFQEIPFWHTLTFPTMAVWKLFFPSCLRGIIVPSPFPTCPAKWASSHAPAPPHFLLRKGTLFSLASPAHHLHSLIWDSQGNISSLQLTATTNLCFETPLTLSLNLHQLAPIPTTQTTSCDSIKFNQCMPILDTGEAG